jgi:hypothetical protein
MKADSADPDPKKICDTWGLESLGGGRRSRCKYIIRDEQERSGSELCNEDAVDRRMI